MPTIRSFRLGGIAVVYDATQIDNMDGSYAPSRFRTPWLLNANVPLIGMNLPALNNGSDFVGIWSDLTSYEMDLGDVNGNMRVVQFDNSVAHVDYREPEFPGGSGESIYWLGTGNYQDGNEWAQSMDMVDGAYESQPSTIQSTFNNVNDVANPGVIPGGSAAAGLLITEIMYNPASDEPDWEFIEVYNNTGSNIDFGANPHFLDEGAGTLAGPNVTQGSIADGEVAIFYNSDTTQGNFETAWGNTLNAIPVSDWGSLNQGGDSIGIWDDQTLYNDDRTNGVLTNAISSVEYDNNNNDWPNDDGAGSIYRDDLSGMDPNVGDDWALSMVGDGIGSVNAMPVNGTVPDHPGGDIGSPGTFPGGDPPMVDGDFDDNGFYECADVDALVAEIVAGTNDPNFDLNGDTMVDGTDLDLWRAEAGAILTMSGNPIQRGDATLDGTVDGQDFLRWNSNKFTNTAAWCAGDFDANGAVDGADFIVWNGEKFTSADAVAVPEPTSLALLLGIVGICCLRRQLR